MFGSITAAAIVIVIVIMMATATHMLCYVILLNYNHHSISYGTFIIYPQQQQTIVSLPDTDQQMIRSEIATSPKVFRGMRDSFWFESRRIWSRGTDTVKTGPSSSAFLIYILYIDTIQRRKLGSVMLAMYVYILDRQF